MLAYQLGHCEQNAPALLCRGLAPGTAIKCLAGGSYCIINVLLAGLGNNADSFSVEGIHNIPSLFRRCPLVIDEVLVSFDFRFCLHKLMPIFPTAVNPLLASPQGGVAERTRKCREASADREAGVVFRSYERKTTPAASASVASQIFLMTQPPLLAAMQGGE